MDVVFLPSYYLQILNRFVRGFLKNYPHFTEKANDISRNVWFFLIPDP